MRAPRCTDPLPLSDLVDYLSGELDPGVEDRVESHFFACERCARRLESVERLGAGVARLVRAGRVVAAVTGEVLERAAGEGLKLREYRLTPGATVPCTAAPDDDFVVVRLAGDFGDAARVDIDVDTADLESGARRATRTRDVAVDHRRGEIVLLFPGDIVRTYPRSVWTMRVKVAHPAGERDLGPYVMDHTPWDQVPVPG